MTETFFREALLEAAPDVATGTVRLSFASPLPVMRRDKQGQHFREILSLAPGDCNLGLLNTQGIVLQDHNDRKEIGTVVVGSAKVETDKKCRATIMVIDREWKERLKTSASGIPVSVGYTLLSRVREIPDTADGIPTRFFSWRPHEISLLTGQAADDTVGIGRSKTSMQKSLVDIIREQAETADGPFSRAACRDYDLASLFECAVKSNRQTLPTEGSFEYRQHRAIERQMGMINSGTFVPFAALLPNTRAGRDMQVDVFGAGGAGVTSDWAPAAELLYNHTCVGRSGATIVSGLTGQFVKPRVTSAVTASTVTELGAATPSGLTLDQLVLTPKRLTVQVPVSTQLLMQTGGVAMELIKASVRQEIGVKLDSLALFGQGAGSEPQGLLNTPGVGVLTLGGAMTWPNVTLAEETISLLNAPEDKLGWIISPKTRNRWKNIPRIASSSLFIMEGNTVGETPCCTTMQMSSQDQFAYGNWPTFLILIWGSGIDLLIDPVTKAGIGECVITAHLWWNCLPVHPQCFVVSADSAEQ